MDSRQQLNTHFEQEETLDVREILLKMINIWYWFVICGIFGAGLGMLPPR
jgi:hypothetical protein